MFASAALLLYPQRPEASIPLCLRRVYTSCRPFGLRREALPVKPRYNTLSSNVVSQLQFALARGGIVCGPDCRRLLSSAHRTPSQIPLIFETMPIHLVGAYWLWIDMSDRDNMIMGAPSEDSNVWSGEFDALACLIGVFCSRVYPPGIMVETRSWSRSIWVRCVHTAILAGTCMAIACYFATC
jgi:hypothetical protein